jgi:mannose-6-phosphate isomerase-like protein (cupin superfamily)
MSEMKYLEGKVLKRPLPVFHGSPPAGTVGAKRLLLPQGELAQFYDAPEAIHYIAFIELRSDGIRGNHWHRNKEEQIYVISGELLLVAEDRESHSRVEISLKAGELALIACGVAHALKTVMEGKAIEFSKSCFDPTDVERFTVI